MDIINKLGHFMNVDKYNSIEQEHQKSMTKISKDHKLKSILINKEYQKEIAKIRRDNKSKAKYYECPKCHGLNSKDCIVCEGYGVIRK
jgi:hypothetical protein